eukprot:g97.t1
MEEREKGKDMDWREVYRLRKAGELFVAIQGRNKYVTFGAHENCATLRQLIYRTFAKVDMFRSSSWEGSFVFRLRQAERGAQSRILGILAAGDYPVLWLQKMLGKYRGVFLQFEARGISNDTNGIEAMKLPEDCDEQAMHLLIKYLHRIGTRFDCLDISSSSIHGEHWCVLSKARLFFLPTQKKYIRNIAYVPLDLSTTCNVVAPLRFQLCVRSRSSTYDPITFGARSRDDLVAWVETLTNRDSVVSENQLFETAELQISAGESASSRDDHMLLRRLEALEGVLRNRFTRIEFRKFLKKESSEGENMLRFWVECERYRTTHPGDHEAKRKETKKADARVERGAFVPTTGNGTKSSLKGNEPVSARAGADSSRHSPSSSDSILPDVVQLKRVQSSLRKPHEDDDVHLHAISSTANRNQSNLLNHSAIVRRRDHPRRPRKDPPRWIPDSQCDTCMWPDCNLVFRSFGQKMLNANREKSRHHCRGCGGLFCDHHCSKTLPLPFFGLRNPVRVCDECWTFFFQRPSTRRSVSGSESSEKGQQSRSFRAVSAREMSSAYARRIHRNFVSKDAPLGVSFDKEDGEYDMEASKVMSRLRDAPRDLFVGMQRIVFDRLRNKSFARFRQMKTFRHLQHRAMYTTSETLSSHGISTRASTHHLKRQYGSFTIGAWGGDMSTENTANVVMDEVSKQCRPRSSRSRKLGRRGNSYGRRYGHFGVVAASGALEEWEKPEAWMNLENVTTTEFSNGDDNSGGFVDYLGPDKRSGNGNAKTTSRTHLPSPHCAIVFGKIPYVSSLPSSTSPSVSFATPRSKSITASSMCSSASSTLSSTPRSVLLRSSVGVWSTPPLRPTHNASSLDLETKCSPQIAGCDAPIDKMGDSKRGSDEVVHLNGVETRSTVATTPIPTTRLSVVNSGWLSCRRVVPWAVAVSNVAISSGGVASRRPFLGGYGGAEDALAAHFYVLAADGLLVRYADERMDKSSCDRFVDAKRNIIEVTWAKESGSSERSFEIVTKSGIFIMQPDLPGTCSHWIKSISTLVAMSRKKEVVPRIVLDGYLWKRSRGRFGLIAPQMQYRRFRLVQRESRGIPCFEYFDSSDARKGTIDLDGVLDVFCRAPTRSEVSSGIMRVSRSTQRPSAAVSAKRKDLALRYLFEIITPERRWVLCAESPEELRDWYLSLRRFKGCFQ